MSEANEHPMQPIIRDEDGTVRFKENKIVSFLLTFARGKGVGLNELAAMPFSREDREQFAQLIGYSVSGFGELNYARPENVAKADKIAREMEP